jgi:PKD repeat protein
LLGVESFPSFNNPAFSGGTCPDSDGQGGEAWPCTPLGAYTHELGHTFGLPHPADVPATAAVAGHSVMQTHWNYPNQAPADELPWAFLRDERQTLWANSFMKSGVALRQPFQALDTAVNLTSEGAYPTAGFDVEVNGDQVSVHNHTQDTARYYWTFGDYNVSNEVSPSYTFPQPGSYTLMLRASSNSAMMGVASRTVVIAPNDLIFADAFEADDPSLSAWSCAVTDSSDLSFQGEASLVPIGAQGMLVVIDDNRAIYVCDNRPNTEPHYRARFYFDPNSIKIANGNAHHIFYGYSGTSKVVLRVEFRFSSGKYQLRTALLNDATTWKNSGWFTISDAPHFIELDWQASSAAGANNGSLGFWINGVQKANLAAVDNDTRRIDSVRLGAVTGIDAGTRGIYYFDAFESRRQTYIGPVAGAQAAAISSTMADPTEVNNWTEEEATQEELEPREGLEQEIFLPLVGQ